MRCLDQDGKSSQRTRELSSYTLARIKGLKKNESNATRPPENEK